MEKLRENIFRKTDPKAPKKKKKSKIPRYWCFLRKCSKARKNTVQILDKYHHQIFLKKIKRTTRRAIPKGKAFLLKSANELTTVVNSSLGFQSIKQKSVSLLFFAKRTRGGLSLSFILPHSLLKTYRIKGILAIIRSG